MVVNNLHPYQVKKLKYLNMKNNINLKIGKTKSIKYKAGVNFIRRKV